MLRLTPAKPSIPRIHLSAQTRNKHKVGKRLNSLFQRIRIVLVEPSHRQYWRNGSSHKPWGCIGWCWSIRHGF